MRKTGFTLIELLVVVAILAVLIGATIIAINPLKQIGDANNSARWAGVTTIMNAIYQNIIDNGGVFSTTTAGCGGDIPTTATTMASTAYNICPCIASSTTVYVGQVPIDPTAGSYTSCSNYNTGYTIIKNSTTGRITITAPAAQNNESISLTR